MIKKIALALIKIYQKTLSPDHGLLQGFFPYGACKYHPTCSQYSYEAINKFGILKGAYYSIKRVIRCNPFSNGGIEQI